MDKNNVFKNTLLLTCSGIIAKTIDFFFRAHYSKLLGGEGCGLLSLVFSVHSIMLTFATAGISVATSKLVSKSIAEHNLQMTKSIMKSALCFTFCSSVAVIFFAAVSSDFISREILKDSRCQIPLLCLLPSVMFMSVSYCLKGYFYASRKILIPASSEFLEQFVKITSITLLLKKALAYGTEQSCGAVFLGISLGEFSSFAYLCMFFKSEQKLYKKICSAKGAMIPVLKTSLPAMASSLSGSYLHMQEELLMVFGLKKHGLSHTNALSAYGSLSGMVIPLTMFPLTLLSSFLTLLVPEISRAAARATKTRLCDLSQKVYKFSAVLSFLLFSIYFSFSDEIGAAVYGNKKLGTYIKIFSLLLPVCMTDSVSSGILNGLGKQTTLLFLTLAEAAIRIGICFFAVPKFGCGGIAEVIFSGCLFSFCIKLSITSAQTTSPINLKNHFILPAFSAFAACFASYVFTNKDFSVAFCFAMCIVFYTAFSFFTKNLTKTEFIWAIKRMKGD